MLERRRSDEGGPLHGAQRIGDNHQPPRAHTAEAVRGATEGRRPMLVRWHRGTQGAAGHRQLRACSRFQSAACSGTASPETLIMPSVSCHMTGHKHAPCSRLRPGAIALIAIPGCAGGIALVALLLAFALPAACTDPPQPHAEAVPKPVAPRPVALRNGAPRRRARPASVPRRAAPRSPAPSHRTQEAAAPRSAAQRAAARQVITAREARQRYPWHRRRAGYEPLASRFPAPAGFRRISVPERSYAHWLRYLPLLPKRTPVRDYAGSLLPGSTAAAAAVVDLDVGQRDLQQCVDTLLRLRAEYLWWRRRAYRIRFRYDGGRYFGFSEWARGVRPRRQGRRILFERRARPSYGRRSLRRYLTFLYAMTGTMHHVQEPRVRFAHLAPGDFFIQPPPKPGWYGHAVVILDVARDAGGHLRALLGEGYTPAQDFHVLHAPGGGAWYRLSPTQPVQTPLWPSPFTWRQLHRFRY